MKHQKLLFMATAVLCVSALAQTPKQPLAVDSNQRVNNSMKVPSGKGLTIESGGALTLESGATVTGFDVVAPLGFWTAAGHGETIPSATRLIAFHPDGTGVSGAMRLMRLPFASAVPAGVVIYYADLFGEDGPIAGATPYLALGVQMTNFINGGAAGDGIDLARNGHWWAFESDGVNDWTVTDLGDFGSGAGAGLTLPLPGSQGGTGVTNTGKSITLGGSLTTSGAFDTTLTMTAATNVTLPTTGTLATRAGSETFTNKTISGTLNNFTNISLSGTAVTGTLPLTKGGTGEATLEEARAAMGGIQRAGDIVEFGGFTPDFTGQLATITGGDYDGSLWWANGDFSGAFSDAFRMGRLSLYTEGLVTFPTLTFSLTDTNTGIWHPTDEQIAITANGANVATFGTTGVTLTSPLAGASGGTGVSNSGKTITLAGNLTTAGSGGLTLTTSGGTNVTLPTTGTLATRAGTETLTNKTIDAASNTITNVSLTAGVTGVLPGANGGTGVANSGKTITLGGNLTTSGANAVTLTTSGATNVTLPTTGTLATLAGTETLTNKTINGSSNTITNVSLTAGVTGVLPTANGGTGIAYFTAAGPTAARTYTFPDASGNVATTIFKMKAGDTSRTSTTTVTDDPDLSQSLTPGTYSVEISANVVCASGTPGVKFKAALTGGTATSGGWMSLAGGGDLPRFWLGPDAFSSSLSDLTNDSSSLTPNLSWSVRMQFSVLVTATTTLSLQWAQQTSSSDSTAVKGLSYMKITHH